MKFIKHLLTIFFVLSLINMTGCARPESMLVRKGNAPDKIDKYVAFRTTYYFRVFDYCANRKRVDEYFDGGNNIDHTTKSNRLYTILNDSLYRFTMTGKASTLLNKIKFESGTLTAAEIDPFGSKIIYDEKQKRFRYSSRQEALQKAITDTRNEEFEKYLERLQKKRQQYQEEILEFKKKLGEFPEEEAELSAEQKILKKHYEILKTLKRLLQTP